MIKLRDVACHAVLCRRSDMSMSSVDGTDGHKGRQQSLGQEAAILPTSRLIAQRARRRRAKKSQNLDCPLWQRRRREGTTRDQRPPAERAGPRGPWVPRDDMLIPFRTTRRLGGIHRPRELDRRGRPLASRHDSNTEAIAGNDDHTGAGPAETGAKCANTGGRSQTVASGDHTIAKAGSHDKSTGRPARDPGIGHNRAREGAADQEDAQRSVRFTLGGAHLRTTDEAYDRLNSDRRPVELAGDACSPTTACRQTMLSPG